MKSAKLSQPIPRIRGNTPQPPKKALTAFFLYRQEVYEEVRKDNPECNVTEISRIISEMWNNLEKGQKEVFEAEYHKNKAKYERQKEAYEKIYGTIITRRRRRSKRGH